MSLESALAEEAREVMALLEGRQLQSNQPPARNRATSPGGVAQSPVRSMLDIGDPGPVARHASIAGIGAGVTRPGYMHEPVRSSMLDPSSPPPMSPRSPPPRSPPPPGRSLMGPTINVEDEFKFDMIPRNDIPALPKRVTQGGKKQKSAMSSVYGSEELPYRPQARHLSFHGGGHKSMSPGPRGQGRSQSPSTRMLNQNSMNLMTTPGKYVSDSGQVIDINNAYRRLSDAALLKSGSSLAQLPTKKFNRKTGESQAPDGGVRLAKDYNAPDEDVIDSSDEGNSDSDADDDSARRGRGRTRKGSEEQDDDGRSKPKSLLSAVEQERKDIAKQHTYRSLLEPEVKVTGPDGEKPEKPLKRGIHPSTSFDASSEVSSIYDSDREEALADLRRAQTMNISISPVHSTPSAHRCIRQIIRGDYEKFNQEAEQGLRRQRMYLVASDMSPESEYALEWTVGTVLRDGDTLLAVYAADEEVAAEEAVLPGGPRSPPIDASAKGEDVVKDLSMISRTLSNEASLTVPGTDSGADTPSPRHSNASVNETGSSDSASLRHRAMANAGIRSADGLPRDPSQMDAAERQRLKFTDAITDRVVGLLRKTKLQVRVVVEVFHCKSPKHMITEVVCPPSPFSPFTHHRSNPLTHRSTSSRPPS
jgi:hypothetical protein